MNLLDAAAPATVRALQAGAVVLLYLLLCGAVWLQHRRRLQRTRPRAAPGTGTPVLVAYATQTGFAEELALHTVQLLQTAGVPALLRPLDQLTADELRQSQQALFIASTYGEGDPPDSAARFMRGLFLRAPRLRGLHHAVLALGDRGYRHYCGFGQQLDLWLAARGSTPLFERIEVNRGDPEALTAWRHHVARLAGTTDLPDWDAPAFQRWRLARRVCLNPGSAGAPAFHLELEPLDAPALPAWEAGDLAQVQVPGAAEPREYSVASLPSDGRLHLLARQHRHADGSLGLASGWLTAQAAVGDEVALRLRVHQHFRIGDNAQRPLVLIGSGTGLAGLRAHLKARAAQPAATRAPAWLLFGERQAAHDSFHGDELQAWLRDGVLARLDRVYSRDGGEQRYVQHRLAAQAQAVRRWVSDGAAIYVCGSLAGMGQDVHATLTEVLGAGTIAQLAEQGRYRRDVY